MAMQIAVGDEGFEEIRKSGLYYVDKTELLYDLVSRTKNKVTLFTRPRRFGKTLNMSMMESFFEIGRDSRAVFDGLNVVKHEDFCHEWMNQYPVLFLSFKDVDGLDFESAFITLQGVISDLCFRYSHIFDNDKIDPVDKATFAMLKEKRLAPAALKSCLKTIMRMMNAAYGRPDLLLSDFDNRRAMIIEAKKSDSAAHMERDCNAALKQIVDNEYAKNLDQGFETVLCFGISFFRKSALIKKLSMPRIADRH